MAAYFVTRHEGTERWARLAARKRRLPFAIDAFRTHIDPATLRPGDVVMGTLPVHVIAQVIARSAAFRALDIDVPPGLRGVEMSATQLAACNARLSDFALELELAREKDGPTMLGALTKVGVVRLTEETEKVRGWRGSRDEPVRVYTLTEAAKPFVRESQATMFQRASTDFCWGRLAVDRIVRWQGPKVQGDYQEVKVTFTFRVLDMPERAKDPAIQQTFPTLRRELGEAGKREIDLDRALSTDGWRLRDKVVWR